jgi:hypothetical protein
MPAVRLIFGHGRFSAPDSGDCNEDDQNYDGYQNGAGDR